MTSNGLFKRFDRAAVTQLAASRATEQRTVRKELADQFPALDPYWEAILPKKQDIMLVHTGDNVVLVALVPEKGLTEGVSILFFRHHDGPYLPSLRLLHQYPIMMTHLTHRVDIGGCKFVVSGSNVMCPGLTSPGGSVGPGIPRGAPVAIYIEGKKHAVAVGITLMSSDEIVKINKGHCIENVHHLGDGLWRTPVLAHTV